MAPATRSVDLDAIDRTIDTLAGRLLDQKLAPDHWEGSLASSALATATAAIALTIAGRTSGHEPGESPADTLVRGGAAWLVAHQNDDGGWGDTRRSRSNLSTTALCWCALSLSGGTESRSALARVERWIQVHVGSLEPEALRRALLDRYGRDRTFSVPILTVLALAGKLGDGRDAWRLVPQLPFELAAFPHQWFRWLRLPVVSYALPALVAMGHVRHHRAPTHLLPLALVRSMLRPVTLRVARDMQPYSGGFLEAVPLTGFVVMSLIDAGSIDDPVVTHGVRFLRASARADGSWPIDTNLATWVTTLSVDALDATGRLSPDDGRRILDWLLEQQSSDEHPFTHAAPGGWGWTNLSGSVPDADDTSAALMALATLSRPRGMERDRLPPEAQRGSSEAPSLRDAATAGIRWLLDLQNRDGGIPTFCRGWGALPFDRSAPDLTAHALKAWSTWSDVAPLDMRGLIASAEERAVTYLAGQQRGDGSWAPLWFGNEHAKEEINLTYGTARVVAALASATLRDRPDVRRSWQRGVEWLLDAQGPEGGWGGNAGTPTSIEETGLALQAVALGSHLAPEDRVMDALVKGCGWLIEATNEGRTTPAAPIGLYFARLWYYEELYPLIFSLKGLTDAYAALAARQWPPPDAV